MMTTEETAATDIPAPRSAEGYVIDKPVSRRGNILFFCITLFITCLLGAVITSFKVQTYDVFGWVILIPAGTILFSLCYLATDVISEVWGRAYAFRVVLLGILMRLIILLYFYFAISAETWFGSIGVAPFWTPEQQEAYASVLGGSQRIIIAGFVSFFVSSIIDVFIFHTFKQRDLGKNRLWFRNNFSTIVSQVINSLIFVSLAFGAVATIGQILSLIAGQVFVKVLMAFLDTPLIYVLRNYAMNRKLTDFSG